MSWKARAEAAEQHLADIHAMLGRGDHGVQGNVDCIKSAIIDLKIETRFCDRCDARPVRVWDFKTSERLCEECAGWAAEAKLRDVREWREPIGNNDTPTLAEMRHLDTIITDTPTADPAPEESEGEPGIPVPQEVHARGWQWRPTADDTAFAPPFGTIRLCRHCGCLVTGGPTACVRCAETASEGSPPDDTPTADPAPEESEDSADAGGWASAIPKSAGDVTASQLECNRCGRASPCLLNSTCTDCLTRLAPRATVSAEPKPPPYRTQALPFGPVPGVEPAKAGGLMLTEGERGLLERIVNEGGDCFSPTISRILLRAAETGKDK